MREAVELQRREFGGKRPGPHLLITGGVHGDEFEPIFAIQRLIRHFDSTNSEPRLQQGRLSLVPIVNETAFRCGMQTAEDGLDLARVCPGRQDGTITERTAFALSALINEADGYIDLHSGGTRFSVLPLAGYTLHPDEAIRGRQREFAEAFNLPIVWGTSPELDGRSLSVARDAGVPAIYAEYHGGGRCDPQGVEAYVAGCFNVLSLLGMIHWKPPPSRVGRVVEDPRPAAGHMQVCNPSPISGVFEPIRFLGDSVNPHFSPR